MQTDNKYEADDVEDKLIPILLQVPILAKYRSMIESAYLRKHRMDEQRLKGRTYRWVRLTAEFPTYT